MAGARSEEDADVACPGSPGRTGRLVPYGAAVENRLDFIGNRGGTLLGRFRYGKAQNRLVHGPVGGRIGHGKAIALLVGELACGARGLRHLREQVVDEMQQFWNRSKAAGDRPAGPAAGAQAVDEPGRLFEDADLRVAEPVDGLLPITDDEDRGARGHAKALSPRPDEERHELPLGTAGVLELVDQHMVVPRLETEAALRELVHLPQQLDRLL